jgi:hypothetical protein
LLLLCAISLAVAQTATLPAPPGCIGSAPLGKFRVSVYRPDKGAELPLKEISAIPPGARLNWDPVHVSPHFSKGEIAVLIMPQSHGSLTILPPRKAAEHEEWDLPQGAGVIALVLSADELKMSKVESLLANNEDLLSQLADYAQQTSEVESLVQELANSQQSHADTDAALRGFGSRWGVAMPKLDTTATTGQQASTLLTALLPTANTYDPLAPANAQMQQTAGLAASVAGLFFGNSVGLAAGGTMLVSNLGAVLFPDTEFRSALAQSAQAGVLAFCAKNGAAKSRTRVAYLWAYRVPNVKLPPAALHERTYLPMGSKSTVKLKTAEGSNAKDLARARDWRLVPLSGGAETPVSVAKGSAPNSLTLDLTKCKTAAGEYRLTASWDWDRFSLGTLHLRPYSDFAQVRLSPESRDQLIQGNGLVTAKFRGADFEFVDKVELQKVAARPGKPTEAHFELPGGARRGEQNTLNVDIDTASPGEYHLLLAQSDGVEHAVPVTVLPPNPKISDLPIHVNVGETEEVVRLSGTGLDRVESVSSDAGEISGAAGHNAWSGKIHLKQEAQVNQRFPLVMRVQGLEAPISIPDAILVVGPRPKILSARKSLPQDLGIEIHAHELPAGTSVGLVIATDHLTDAASQARPRLTLTCQSGELRKALTISPDEHVGSASLSFAGPDSLYLSLDPGIVGYPDCELVASVAVEPRGSSDAFAVGRVVRVPLLEKFTLTNDALGSNAYAGVLQGRDLDVIEKTGWDAQSGLPVAGIPTPVPGETLRETLRIALPWPAPAPHAPLYIWLRGEQTGRRTNVTD